MVGVGESYLGAYTIQLCGSADFGRVRVLSRLGCRLAGRALPGVGRPLTVDTQGPTRGAWFRVASAVTYPVPAVPA